MVVPYSGLLITVCQQTAICFVRRFTIQKASTGKQEHSPKLLVEIEKVLERKYNYAPVSLRALYTEQVRVPVNEYLNSNLSAQVALFN